VIQYFSALSNMEESMAATDTSPETTPKPALPRRRGCWLYVRRVLKWSVIGLLLLVVLGVVYQIAATEIDKRTYATPPSQYHTVNGVRMHLHCMGEGSPTIILEAGGYSFSTEWYWIHRQLAKTNRTCAYDRAGAGWSDPSTQSRTAIQIAKELHDLLLEAKIPGPYVLAGHSFGGILNRVYTSQYPDEVAGIVLVDSAHIRPAAYKDRSEFEEWKRGSDILQGSLWVLVRTGVMRFIIRNELEAAGYPPDAVAPLTALKSTNLSFDTYYTESVPSRWDLTQVWKAAQDLGARPLIVLWDERPHLSERDVEIFKEIREEIAGYSTNSVTRFIPGANHTSIQGNEQYAQQVSGAILEVVESVRTGKPLAK
jgi:pimeloyl-ACP methyl ester carboxylesterase